MPDIQRKHQEFNRRIVKLRENEIAEKKRQYKRKKKIVKKCLKNLKIFLINIFRGIKCNYEIFKKSIKSIRTKKGSDNLKKLYQDVKKFHRNI